MKSVAIDFDGVIHQYSKGWQDGKCYDSPVMDAFNSIKQLFREGFSVFVLSTRDSESILKWFEQWSDLKCEIIPDDVKWWNKGYVLGITNRKLPAQVYIDDRAICFKGNWIDVMGQVTGFCTYQEVKTASQ